MPRGPYWTTEDVDRLRAAYPSTTKTELQALFPGRPIGGLTQKARELGLVRNAGVAFQRRYPLRRPLTDAELAYIAGIVDGEGHITILSAKRSAGKYVLHTPVVGVTNQSEDLIFWLDDRIAWTSRSLPPDTSGHTWVYRPSLMGHSAAILLRALLPFLVIKGDRAQLVIQFCEMRAQRASCAPISPEEREIIAQVRRLNQKRPLPLSALSLSSRSA